MGTAITHPVPDRVKPSFVILDIWALWRSGRRQSVNRVLIYMSINHRINRQINQSSNQSNSTSSPGWVTDCGRVNHLAVYRPNRPAIPAKTKARE